MYSCNFITYLDTYSRLHIPCSAGKVRFGPVQCHFLWTLDWTEGPVQGDGQTLDRTDVRFKKGPVRIQTASEREPDFYLVDFLQDIELPWQS
jgi:hypothetical protein